MTIIIEAAAIHALDAQASEPILSQAPVPLTEEMLTYCTAQLSRAFQSEDTKSAARPESDTPLAPYLYDTSEDFIASTAQIATQWFALMAQYPSIPAGDVLFIRAMVDGTHYLAALKLNYKKGYVHALHIDENGFMQNDITQHNALLPSKADEAFFIPQNDADARVLEKPYEIDGSKCCYLASRLLGCRAGLSPKQKLAALQDAAAEVNQKFYGNIGVEESELAAAVCEEFYAAQEQDAPVQVADVCEKLYGDMPHAKAAFTEALKEYDMDVREELPLTGAAVRRLEKQSLRNADGVEIKVPVSLYKNPAALEFIHNDDGTTSLLIKNILI